MNDFFICPNLTFVRWKFKNLFLAHVSLSFYKIFLLNWNKLFYDFFLSWTLKCFLMPLFVVKVASQMSHLYGFFPSLTATICFLMLHCNSCMHILSFFLFMNWCNMYFHATLCCQSRITNVTLVLGFFPSWTATICLLMLHLL